MADVLTGEFVNVCKSSAKYDLRQQICHEWKSKMMPSPLDLYYQRFIISLWKRGENSYSVIGFCTWKGGIQYKKVDHVLAGTVWLKGNTVAGY